MDKVKNSAHCLAVANKMYEFAIKLGKSQETAEDYFTIGLLHNIGREFSNTPNEHREYGGLLLKRMEYQYWREIYYLGVPNAIYKSLPLTLLNLADMTTGKDGTPITMASKLVNLAQRFGVDSEAFKNTSAMVLELKESESFLGKTLNELLFDDLPEDSPKPLSD